MTMRTAGDTGASDARPPRRRFSAFGGVLAADLEFPELLLLDVSAEPHWVMRISENAPPVVEVSALGERRVGLESYSLSRTPTGFRLEYSHAGVFDLSEDGTEIVWYRRADAIEELVRSIILGPVLALSLELSGLFCLHGSAVAIGHQAIVFLGPKHHGKSTLATALTVAGARLIADDLVVIAPGTPAMVRPGVPSVRLWDDAVGALPVHALCNTVIRGVKTTVSGFAERAFTRGELPLAAIYLLDPVAPREAFACARTRLPLVAAAIGLAHQTKLADSLIGMTAAGAKLASAAKLATSVPIWTLTSARDLGRLPAVVAQVMEWHGGIP